MLKKIKKFYLYIKVCHKGEILKRIEYKIKDLIGFFQIRTIIQSKNNSFEINDININVNNIKLNINTDEETYRVFNNKFHYKNITNYFSNKTIFWRKQKINEYEDVKNIWEYNRLQILPAIAIKYINTKKEEYKNEIIRILDCWEENNEFDYTINWNNNLEIAIRAINIVLSLILIQDEKINKKYTKLLYLHAKHIYSEIEYSNICIPNNHVIGEATALLVLSNILNVKENKKWHNKSIKILSKYINIIDDEGVSKENSFSYQFFVTKMYILSLCFIKEKKLFEKINEKIIESLKILKYTIIDDKRILNYGDNDDGFLYSIYMDYSIAKDIREYYNLFFKDEINNETSIYIKIFNKFNLLNKITLGKEEQKNYILTKKVFIYRWNNNILFFNAKNIEGHAHNDSLAINLIINKKEVLLDSGTYSYNKSKQDRKYYRSREAHNTILLNDCNAIDIGSFRWKNNNNSFIIGTKEAKEYIEIQGIIQNICKREIRIYKNENKIDIIDSNQNSSEQIINNWILPIDSRRENAVIYFNNIKISYQSIIEINKEEIEISKRYSEKEKAICYQVKNNKKNIHTNIGWE